MSIRTVKAAIVISLCFTGYGLFALGRYGAQPQVVTSLVFGAVAIISGLLSLRMRARKDVRR